MSTTTQEEQHFNLIVQLHLCWQQCTGDRFRNKDAMSHDLVFLQWRPLMNKVMLSASHALKKTRCCTMQVDDAGGNVKSGFVYLCIHYFSLSLSLLC